MSKFIKLFSLVLFMVIALAGNAKATPQISSSTAPSSYELTSRIRSGGTGFRGVIYAGGTAQSLTQIGNGYNNISDGNYRKFVVIYNSSNGNLTLKIDFNDDNTYQSTEIASYNSSYTNKGFKFVNIGLNGGGTPVKTANLMNLNINGTDFSGTYSCNVDGSWNNILFDESNGGFSNITLTGEFMFSGPNGSEQPRLWVQLGQPIDLHTGLDDVVVDDDWSTLSSGTSVVYNNKIYTIGTDAFSIINNGVNAVNTNGTVNVLAGTYNEDVNINKTLSLIGSGSSNSFIVGQIGGDGATIKVTSMNVLVDGFSITRAGNNTTDWNNAGLNSAGIAIQGQTVKAEVKNCNIYGNRTGIDINNSNGNNIHNNQINNNRTGLIFRNQTDYTNCSYNEISNNWTVGILFLDASGGTNSPLQQALNSTFNNNNISGNWYGQIVDRQVGGSLPPAGSNMKNFECNWYGSTSPVYSVVNSTEPGYAAQIPVIYGGTAIAPGGQPDVLGLAAANFDYLPYLVSNGGPCTGAPVTNVTQTKYYTKIQTAINEATNGDVIEVSNGTYVQTTTLNLNKEVTLIGESEANCKIDISAIGSTTWGIFVDANNFTMKNFTILPNTISGGYPFHVSNESGITHTNISFENITVIGAKKTPFDFHNVDNVTLTNLTAKNTVSGNGVSLTGCHNVTVTGLTTSGNFWGGVAVYCSGPSLFNRASDNINISASTSTLGELNPLYVENLGSLVSTNINATGFDYIAKSTANTLYTWYNPTLNGAVTYMTSLTPPAFPTFYQTTYITKKVFDGNYWVGNNGTNSMKIQKAIDVASAGNTINVLAGSYTEQVTINKSISLIGANKNTTFINAPSTIPIASNPLSNIITVTTSGTQAEIAHLTIQGPGPSGCGSIGKGIYIVNDAYAWIHDNNILDIRDNPFSGCQNGVAIRVGSLASSTSGAAVIENNTISGYQKGAIVIDGLSNAVIAGNTITGRGTTNITAQNGVQISRGASALIYNNTISGNSYHSVGSDWDWGAAGILLYQSAGVSLTGGNNIYGNDLNYYAENVTGALNIGADVFGASSAPLNKGYHIYNYTDKNINATNATFEGKLGSAMNMSEYYLAESRIWDLKDEAGLGLVTIRNGSDNSSMSLVENYTSSNIWVDNNTYNANATVPSGANNPSKNTNDTEFNGQTSVSFDGNDIMTTPYNNSTGRINNNASKSLFVYFRTGASTTARQVVYEAGGANSGFNVYVYNGRIYMGIWNSSSRRFFYQTCTSNTNYLVSIEYNSATGYARTSINGVASSALTFTGFSAENSLYGNGIGGAYNSSRYMDNLSGMGISYRFTGKISELLCFNSNNYDLRHEVVDYIDTKYGTNYGSTYSGKSIAEDEISVYTWDEGDANNVTETGLRVTSSGSNINVVYSILEAQTGKLGLYDLNGTLVNSIFSGEFNKGENIYNVNSEKLTSGVYFIRAESNFGIESKQVIIIK